MALLIVDEPFDLDGYPMLRRRLPDIGMPIFAIDRSLASTPIGPLVAASAISAAVEAGYLAPGDSGAPWLSASNGEVVGIHRGGDAIDLIYPIHHVADWIAAVIEDHHGEGP